MHSFRRFAFKMRIQIMHRIILLADFIDYAVIKMLRNIGHIIRKTNKIKFYYQKTLKNYSQGI